MGILDQPGMNNIKIKECGELMEVLDPQEFIVHPIYAEWGFAKIAEIRLRKSVIEKLREAKKNLNKIPGCEAWQLKIWDGFRTLETQALLYADYMAKLTKEHPEWTELQLVQAVEIFVSPASQNPAMPAPHNTGAAVDLTLVDEFGGEIDMGTEFDEFTDRSHTDYFIDAKYEESRGFNKNRRLLLTVMQKAGFVNYGDEWWHFSYGDQAWARQNGLAEAIYASVELAV